MAERKGRRICKCECGGIVRGVESFGRLWTWCEKCTPVVKCIQSDGWWRLKDREEEDEAAQQMDNGRTLGGK